MNSSSEKVSEIIRVLDGIAFQTGLLALNAAVVSATAGRSGSEFAVAAGEAGARVLRGTQLAREIAGPEGGPASRELAAEAQRLYASMERLSAFPGGLPQLDPSASAGSPSECRDSSEKTEAPGRGLVQPGEFDPRATQLPVPARVRRPADKISFPRDEDKIDI
jgi:hypothetical protein